MEKGTTFIPLFLKIHSLNFAYDDTIRLSEYQLNIHLYKKFRDVVHVAVVPRYILKREKKKGGGACNFQTNKQIDQEDYFVRLQNKSCDAR